MTPPARLPQPRGPQRPRRSPCTVRRVRCRPAVRTRCRRTAGQPPTSQGDPTPAAANQAKWTRRTDRDVSRCTGPGLAASASGGPRCRTRPQPRSGRTRDSSPRCGNFMRPAALMSRTLGAEPSAFGIAESEAADSRLGLDSSASTSVISAVSGLVGRGGVLDLSAGSAAAAAGLPRPPSPSAWSRPSPPGARQGLDQLDHRHRGVVALARAELDDPGVAARRVRERGPISANSLCTTSLSRIDLQHLRRACRSPAWPG